MGILLGTPSCDVLIRVLDFNPNFRVLDFNPNFRVLDFNPNFRVLNFNPNVFTNNAR